MKITKMRKIIISAIVAIVLFAAYIVFDKRSKKEAENKSAEINQVTMTDSSGQTKIQGAGSYTIEQIPFEEEKIPPRPIPDLDRAVVAGAGVTVSPEAKDLAIEKAKSMQVLLKENIANFPAWIDLGIYQKMGGDYEGALISWKYASKLAPADFISVANIGNLYAYFLKDSAQAEIYYKKAIFNGPANVYLYAQLAEIYRDIAKDLAKARAILEKGIAANPTTSSDLKSLLQSFK